MEKENDPWLSGPHAFSPQGGAPPEYNHVMQENASYTSHPSSVAVHTYIAQPGYVAQPGCVAQPGYITQTGHVAQPGYIAQPVPSGYTIPRNGYTEHQQQSVTVLNERPDSHLCFSIFVFLFCFMPFGIIGLVYSIESRSSFKSGDYAGAITSANSAKSWCVAGLIVGILCMTIYTILRLTVLSDELLLY